MGAQPGDILYAERQGIPGTMTAQEIANLCKPTWISLCASSISAPIKVGATTDGDVMEYDNGTSKYYRLLPIPYDASKDKFYEDWDGTILTNLKASRIITNI